MRSMMSLHNSGAYGVLVPQLATSAAEASQTADEGQIVVLQDQVYVVPRKGWTTLARCQEVSGVKGRNAASMHVIHKYSVRLGGLQLCWLNPDESRTVRQRHHAPGPLIPTSTDNSQCISHVKRWYHSIRRNRPINPSLVQSGCSNRAGIWIRMLSSPALPHTDV